VEKRRRRARLERSGKPLGYYRERQKKVKTGHCSNKMWKFRSPRIIALFFRIINLWMLAV
jgi:hypothetical protein